MIVSPHNARRRLGSAAYKMPKREIFSFRRARVQTLAGDHHRFRPAYDQPRGKELLEGRTRARLALRM